MKATFSAGCFWGVEEFFRALDGVVSAHVGYTGGHVEDPSYEDVCTGTTGHAESIEIEYDPERISYEALLDAFFSMHDPTQLDRQGPDRGSQYRSMIFVHSEDQLLAALMRIEKEKEARAIVTRIERAQTFYSAEEYHQRYLEKRGESRC